MKKVTVWMCFPSQLLQMLNVESTSRLHSVDVLSTLNFCNS